MMHLIAPDRYPDFVDELADMHRLRLRVFKERLDWNVQATDDKEVDEFDRLSPVYLLQRDPDGRVRGCVRMLPTTGPTMLRMKFSELVDDQRIPALPSVWESSRFALDIPFSAPKGASGIASATYELFAGMIEFGLSRALSEIVTVTDLRIERILRRASWPLERICEPKQLGNTVAIVGYLEVSHASLNRVCGAGALKGPILWAPVPLAPAA
jgi:acyl homoserine lactone synthase